jgi:hypothetical protein
VSPAQRIPDEGMALHRLAFGPGGEDDRISLAEIPLARVAWLQLAPFGGVLGSDVIELRGEEISIGRLIRERAGGDRRPGETAGAFCGGGQRVDRAGGRAAAVHAGQRRQWRRRRNHDSDADAFAVSSTGTAAAQAERK